MGLVGRVEGGRALRADLGVGAVVDAGGGVPADPGVAVLEVVPGDERLGEGSGLGDVGDRGREVRPVLHGPELGFRVWVVVGYVGSGVGLGDAEVGEQERDWFGGHRGAAVGVQGEPVGVDVVLGDGVGDEQLGEGGALVWVSIQPTM